MPSAYDTFKSQVIDVIAVPVGGATLDYVAYMAQPDAARTGDEHNFTDSRFTSLLLGWLGYSSADYIYNVNAGAGNIPDWVVYRNNHTIALIIEDKASNISFNPAEHYPQMRRYAAGTQGYALWTNGKRILGFRFDPQGAPQTLVDVSVIEAFGQQGGLLDQHPAIEYLHQTFSAATYNTLATRLHAITHSNGQPITEIAWAAQAQPVTNQKSQETFITDSRTVLDDLTMAARLRIDSALQAVADADVNRLELQARYKAEALALPGQLQNNQATPMPPMLGQDLAALEYQLDMLTPARLNALRPPNLNNANIRLWAAWVERGSAAAVDVRSHALAIRGDSQIAEAYQVWSEKYRVIEETDTGVTDAAHENTRRNAFAEQAAYVFFVRLLLARVLEDKAIIPRLISDGGLASWYDFLQAHTGQISTTANTEIDLLPSLLTDMLYHNVGRFYRHFYDQPVFDWFVVNDYLLVGCLEHLNKYNFGGINRDIIGYTYQTFIDRRERNRKGVFLTPPDVIEYMLDQAGYAGATIIGTKLLDPACGSGSFLVEAVNRLRTAMLDTNTTLDTRRAFIEAAQAQIFGMELNPFSCYLAELNLFIQVLDDLIVLWLAGQRADIKGFNIINTNSLELPRSVLTAQTGQSVGVSPDEAELENRLLGEGAAVKRMAGDFDYVIANPPYINRGIILGAPSYTDFPFYAEILSGDQNTYLLFLQLATYYCAAGGTICYIIPLNIFGDRSGLRAREIFGTYWTIRSLTRFYIRTVLFKGVLQGVCVLNLTKNQPVVDYNLTIHGGASVAEARQPANQFSVSRSHVMDAHLQQRRTTWYKSWLVAAPAEAYAIWQHIVSVTSTDVQSLIHTKLDAGKGDVNSTYVNLVRATSGVPLTKGEEVENFGGWLAAAYTNPNKTGLSGNAENARKKIKRIADLTTIETAIFLKEVSGLEMRRPVRGTVVERSNTAPVVADDTLLSIYSLQPQHADLAYAIFGLLVSSLSNYIFGLFSTNAHVSIAELMRTPIPAWNVQIEATLVAKARATLQAGLALDTLARQVGGRVEADLAVLMVNTPGISTMSLQQAVQSRRVVPPVSDQSRIATLVKNGGLAPAAAFATNTDYAAALRLLLKDTDKRYINAAGQILLPNPNAAPTLMTAYATANTQLTNHQTALDTAIAALDDAVLQWYGITNPAWQAIIKRGMLWST